MKAWGGRFAAGPDANAADFGRSIEVDVELAPEDLEGSLAHVTGLRRAGLLSEEEQRRLEGSRVAVAGAGGVGGIHLLTLARLGIGKFAVADPDVFESVNINRQFGATVRTLGRNKAQVLAEI